MQPIVNGLEEDFGDMIAFRRLNAGTDGSDAFRQLGLPGHPAFVIFLPDGTEVFRAVGIQEEEFMYETLNELAADERANSR